MNVVETQSDVLGLLQNFHGTEPMKELFWSCLNYERVNRPTTRRGWPGSAAEALAEDPTLLAAGGPQNEFQVLYSRLAKDRLSLSDERIVTSRLLKDHPYGLFVFSDRAQTNWHFLNVKMAEEQEKRKLFRRVAVGPNEKMRTASQVISQLDLSTINPNLFGLSPLVIQERHDQAFDVELVTKEFFRQYHATFTHVEALIRGISDKDRKRLYTQRLFNRLMFIAFIQKKGWLQFGAKKNHDYLSALWADYRKNGSKEMGFYDERLYHLFFHGLGAQDDVGIININRGGVFKDLIGIVPYLNGGLFEEEEDDKDGNIQVPDEAIRAVLNDLFDHFNFTVTEATPLDVEVAVDPEMLGMVFEELVTGRHETGSYYTPKPIVSFMCREAIKGDLESNFPKEKSETIAKFVDEHEPSRLKDGEAVLEALRRVRVCDPACGSGAYLLGMLHELMDLRTCLFAARHLDPLSAYGRKLEIIQRNLYGVDKDTFATNIAKLRLWLSLSVEFEGGAPPPLPNLEFKIEMGDALLSPKPTELGQQCFRQQAIAEYFEAKSIYLTAHGDLKHKLRDQIVHLRRQIGLWTHGGKSATAFDWVIDFAEVFTDGGFEIVLANPPYVRADAQFKHLLPNEASRQQAILDWRQYRTALSESGDYQTVYEKWDLYIPFLERAFQLLKQDGRMVFIIPDSYNSAKYADKSHKFFLKQATLEGIDFCSEIPLFTAGVSNTIVHFSKSAPSSASVPRRTRRWGESATDFEACHEELRSGSQISFGASIFKPDGRGGEDSSNALFTPLEMICYLSWGLRPNSDERLARGEFATKDVISEFEDRQHPKACVQGKDTVKWVVQRVRYLEWGTRRAPALFARATFPQLYEVPEKLLIMKVSGTEPRVVYDDQQLLCTDSFCCCVPWHYLSGVRNRSIQKSAKYEDENGNLENILRREETEHASCQFSLKYLMAIMNSEFANSWLAKRRRHKIQLYPEDWKQFPIPPINKQRQKSFVVMVDAILAEFKQYGVPLPEKRAKRLADLEAEVNRQVDRLYESMGLGV